MRHRYPQSSHRLCSQCSQQYAQSPHIREPHSLHVRAQSSHTVLPHPHSTVSVPAQSPHSHPSQSWHRTAHSPDWRSQCPHRRSSLWMSWLFPVICHAPMSSCLPDGARRDRMAAARRKPRGRSARCRDRLRRRHRPADTRTLATRRTSGHAVCRPAGPGPAFDGGTPFRRAPAVWRGAAADPRALRGRAPFSAATRIRLDRDSQNRYHCFL